MGFNGGQALVAILTLTVGGLVLRQLKKSKRRDSESTSRTDDASGEENKALRRDSESTSRPEDVAGEENKALKRDLESTSRPDDASGEESIECGDVEDCDRRWCAGGRGGHGPEPAVPVRHQRPAAVAALGEAALAGVGRGLDLAAGRPGVGVGPTSPRRGEADLFAIAGRPPRRQSSHRPPGYFSLLVMKYCSKAQSAGFGDKGYEVKGGTFLRIFPVV
ncbi:hypothetical protein NL676_034207 [Syzygium grande]|nr:hypothetical protein NL676_034207 [Syzygium grande]